MLALSDDGVIMVDTEFAELHQKIKAAIAALTNLPVRYLVISHFYRDYTGGNAGPYRNPTTNGAGLDSGLGSPTLRTVTLYMPTSDTISAGSTARNSSVEI